MILTFKLFLFKIRILLCFSHEVYLDKSAQSRYILSFITYEKKYIENQDYLFKEMQYFFYFLR